jgi:hypothetical protein
VPAVLVAVQERPMASPRPQPTAINWQDVHYRIRVIIGCWRLATHLWDSEIAVNRIYFCVLIADQQIIGLTAMTSMSAAGCSMSAEIDAHACEWWRALHAVSTDYSYPQRVRWRRNRCRQ